MVIPMARGAFVWKQNFNKSSWVRRESSSEEETPLVLNFMRCRVKLDYTGEVSVLILKVFQHLLISFHPWIASHPYSEIATNCFMM